MFLSYIVSRCSRLGSRLWQSYLASGVLHPLCRQLRSQAGKYELHAAFFAPNNDDNISSLKTIVSHPPSSLLVILSDIQEAPPRSPSYKTSICQLSIYIVHKSLLFNSNTMAWFIIGTKIIKKQCFSNFSKFPN